MLTETVCLIDGVEFGGKRHTNAVLRQPIVADSLAAERKSEGKGAVYLSLAVIAEQTIALGDIPRDKVTADLLSMLTEEDFERLCQCRDVLKKKAAWSPRA